MDTSALKRFLAWVGLALFFCPMLTQGSARNANHDRAANHPTNNMETSHIQRMFLSKGTDDWEPDLAVSGHDVYVIATRYRADSRRAVIWSSHDGGKSFGLAIEPSDGRFDMDGSDPNIQSDSRGDVFASFMSWMQPKNQQPVMDIGGLILATSRDRGKTFTEQSVATPKSGMKDKPVLAVSPDGRDIYIAFMAKNTPDLVASHDSGKTWKRFTVDSRPNLYEASGIALAPNGDLYIANTPSKGTQTTEGLLAAVKNGKPLHLVMRIYKSSDKGATWKYRDIASGTAKIGACVHSSPCPVGGMFPAVAVDGRGEVYVAYVAGDYQEPRKVRMIRSDDGGVMWSVPQVISAAPRPISNDQATAYFPGIAAAGNGLVYITWVDDRTGPLNVWAKCSRNGGRTWSRAVRLSPAQGLKGYYGDYGGMAIGPRGTLHAVFGDGLSRFIKAPKTASNNGPRGGIWYVTWDGR